MEVLKRYFITSPREYREGEVFLFRKKLCIVKEVKRAVLYSTALGVYEIEINGQKAGKQMFAPGFTYYPRRVLYQEEDITHLLKKGGNTLKLYLGQGWYCGRFLCENKTQIYGDMPAISCILKIEYMDGSRDGYCSGPDMEELESPYEYAGEYDGEIYHADIEETVIGKAVKYQKEIPAAFEKTVMEVRIQEEMPVRHVCSCGDKVILDFGQNFAGIIELNPIQLNGSSVTIRHGEILNPDGTLYTENLRKAKAQIKYYAGKDKRIYRPRFTYMGFRYVEITGSAYVPGLIKAYAVYTDMKRTGYFSCGNPLVQKLYENQLWGQKSNYVEIPTDCPQRDERMGYTGDGHVFALTGAYNYDTEKFWEKFLQDMRLGQLDDPDHYIGATVPADHPAGIGMINMLGWGNAVTIIPELLYLHYGNRKILDEMYESMKMFVDTELSKMGEEMLWFSPNLGDWLAPGKDMRWQAVHNGPISNSFIVHDLKVLAETAEKFGNQKDAMYYSEKMRQVREAYLKKYVSDDGIVAGDYQSAYIMALHFVIQEGELRKKVLRKYVENVRANGMETGFFATEHFLPLLAEAGACELAYDMLFQEECPGWMYQIKMGATTTWERWDALRPDGTVNEDEVPTSGDNMVSFNHYAFGSVGEFYYEYILGIKPLQPGFQKIRLQPVVDRRLGYAEGYYKSKSGMIRSAWFYENERIRFSFETPVEAEIILPDGTIHRVKAGNYMYEIIM